MKAPTVSIILPLYNGEQTINRALRSITQQSFTDYEIICINDASTDNSINILKKWRQTTGKIKVQILTNDRNLGLTKTLNRGIMVARGKYIARLDTDDWWENCKLERQIAWLERYPNYRLIGTLYTNHQHGGARLVKLPVTDAEIRTEIFRRNPFGHSCIVVKTELLQQVGGYDEKLRVGQDLDLWFRLLPLTKFYNIPEYLCHRTVEERLDKSKQMLNHITTTVKYIRKYHAPPINYIYLVEPLAVMLTPCWLRKYHSKNRKR